MTWTFLGRLQLENNWVLLPEVDSEIFRISHIQIPNVQGKYLKAAIAVGVEIEGRFNPYRPKLLTYSEHPEIIPLEGFPSQLGIPRLAVQRLDDSSVSWDIAIEAFPKLNTQDNLVNEITKAIMTLFDLDSERGNCNLLPQKSIVECTKGVPILLVGENSKRRALTIKNYGEKALILGRSAAVEQTTGSLLDLNQRFEDIPRRKGYNFPSFDGCIYKGDVYALPKFDGQVEVIEWSQQAPPSEDE